MQMQTTVGINRKVESVGVVPRPHACLVVLFPLFIAGINDVGFRLFWSSTGFPRFVLLCFQFLLNQVEIQLICFGFSAAAAKGKYAKRRYNNGRWMLWSRPCAFICWASKANKSSVGCLWRGCTVGAAVKFNKCKTHSILQILQKISSSSFPSFLSEIFLTQLVQTLCPIECPTLFN